MGLPSRLAFIDVESTGAHPVRDRITEIAILRVEDGVLVERWESLVVPDIPIPPLIQRVTGISNEMVADAPRFDDVVERVQGRLAGRLRLRRAQRTLRLRLHQDCVCAPGARF